MLFATGRLSRRLFRPGDAYHPKREGAKTVPEKEDILERYHALLDWYFKEYVHHHISAPEEDSILALQGLGKEIWADEDPDEYVRSLREGWE